MYGVPQKKFSLFWEHVTFHNLCLLQGIYVKSKLNASTDIENDCQFVLPKLLGQVMKLSNGKANSTQAKEAISELLGNHLINMLLEIRSNLCFLYTGC